MSSRPAYCPIGMAYAPVHGLQLYYEIHGSGKPLVLLHGGLLTIDLNFGPLLQPLAASRQVIAVELQGHGHTADTGRPMTIQALAGDVVALLDHLGIAEADLFGFSLGGLVAYAVAIMAPARVGKLIVASADAHRPPGRESVPISADRMPTAADFQAMHQPVYLPILKDFASKGDRDALESLESIHRRKTGAMFLASLQLGALVGGAGAPRQAALEELRVFSRDRRIQYGQSARFRVARVPEPSRRNPP